ncbi:MAG TPA: hypothetical protein VFK57_13060 [Vicinamibacterales bacterium]|nr:hypothetical protein [Vicinamibacterales bacterium]
MTPVQKPTGAQTASGEWWKACVLLIGLAATALGWMASARGEPPAGSAFVVPETAMPVRGAPVVRADGSERRRVPSARPVPAMPQKPMFQRPVTRTRRS